MAVLTVPIGIVGARFGLKKMFAVGALLQAAGIFAPFCTSYSLLFLTRVCFAIGTAITVPDGIGDRGELVYLAGASPYQRHHHELR